MLKEDIFQLEVCDASIIGFKLHKVVGATYPGLAIDPNTKQPIPGLLAKNLTKKMVKKLDEFEGQNYGRAPVEVKVRNDPNPRSAEVYLPKYPVSLYGKWEFEHWYTHHLSKFLASLRDNCQII